MLIVGREGDSLEHIFPSTFWVIAVLNILALMSTPKDLMDDHMINEVLQNSDGNHKNELPFPATKNVNLVIIFANTSVASSRISLLIPLLMGHVLDSVSMMDDLGIASLVATLHYISPYFSKLVACSALP